MLQHIGVAFPKLITLEIHGTENLEVWEFGNRDVQVDEMMPRVTRIKLDGCKNLIALPTLSKLPSLETLIIQGANQLTYISCGRGTRQLNSFTSFPKLTNLDIRFMENLEVIVVSVMSEGEKGDAPNEIAIIPCLRRLIIGYCPKLKSFRFLTKSMSTAEKGHLWNSKEFELKEEEEDFSLLPCLLDLIQTSHLPV